MPSEPQPPRCRTADANPNSHCRRKNGQNPTPSIPRKPVTQVICREYTGSSNLPEKSDPLQTLLPRISAFHSEFGRSKGTAKSVFASSIGPSIPAQQFQPGSFRQFCHSPDELAECPDLTTAEILTFSAEFQSPRPSLALLDSPAPFLYGPERTFQEPIGSFLPGLRPFPPIARRRKPLRNSRNVRSDRPPWRIV